MKNGDERLVVLNRVARSVVDGQTRQHPTHVFTYEGKPIAADAELGLEEGAASEPACRRSGCTT